MYPPPIPRPERAEGTVLAALLTVLLAVLLVVQFVLPHDRPVAPAVPPVTGRTGPAQIAAVSADPVLTRRSIFQATRLGGGSGSDASGASLGPMGGAYPAGIVRVRGAARLVLQTPGGDSVTLRPGQSWQGWRLTAIGRDDVRFQRGRESVTLALGTADNYSDLSFDQQSYDPSGNYGGFGPNQADEQ